MSWRERVARLRGTVRRRALEREMDAELQFHVDMATERNLREGMTAREARRQAKILFGAAETVREEARTAQRATLVENVLTDARIALRGLRRSPAFTVAALLTVGLGIGASTAVFTLVNAVLLRPLPVPEPEDVIYIGWEYGKGGGIPSLTAFQYEFVRAHSRSLAGAATFRGVEEHLGDEGDVTPIRGLRVTPDFFRVLGFTPRTGRVFDEAEDLPGGPAVVILSDAVWRARFGGDPSIVGRQIRLGGAPHTVVGIMPRDYGFPDAPEYSGYLVPMRLRANPADEGHNYLTIARVRRDASAAAAAADLARTSSAFRAAHADLADNGSFRVLNHAEVSTSASLRRTLWVLFGAVSLVLLIACANTIALLLVRATARQREIAVRASIGAGPRRILQQLLVEGMVLAVLAALLGLVLSHAAVRALLALAPAAFPDPAAIRPDGRVLTYATIVMVVTGLVFGLAAALPVRDSHLRQALLAGGRGSTRTGTRTRELLVFIETAAAVVLLFSATLLTTSFARLIRVDPGFDAHDVIAIRLGRMPPDYDASDRDQLAERVLGRVRTLPGVVSTTAASNLPLERGLNYPVDIASHPELGIGNVELRFVAPDYLATLAIPLRAGREFDASDVATTEPVAIVNESFARHFWGEGPFVGNTIQVGHYKDRWFGQERQTRVIGVVADVRELGLDRDPWPTVLLPHTQAGDGTPVLLVRGRVTPDLLRGLRAAVEAEEPRLAPELERLSAVVSRSVATPRLRTVIITTFAGSALLLAAIGIYGVIASVVQQRRRELGLRMALGATRRGIALAVVRRCLTVVLAGALTGLLGFWAVRRVLASLLYQTSAGDPQVLLVVLALVTAVAALSALIPAVRAARTDPARALRAE